MDELSRLRRARDRMDRDFAQPLEALLRRGDVSVTDACVRVGCTSLGSFSASFTALVGETPSAYRARDHRAAAAIPGCVLKRLGQPGRFREAAGSRSS